MGNVQASSNLPQMPPKLTPIKPRTPQKLNSENRIKNPGSVDELHKKCKGSFFVIYSVLFLVVI